MILGIGREWPERVCGGHPFVVRGLQGNLTPSQNKRGHEGTTGHPGWGRAPKVLRPHDTQILKLQTSKAEAEGRGGGVTWKLVHLLVSPRNSLIYPTPYSLSQKSFKAVQASVHCQEPTYLHVAENGEKKEPADNTMGFPYNPPLYYPPRFPP